MALGEGTPRRPLFTRAVKSYSAGPSVLVTKTWLRYLGKRDQRTISYHESGLGYHRHACSASEGYKARRFCHCRIESAICVRSELEQSFGPII